MSATNMTAPAVNTNPSDAKTSNPQDSANQNLGAASTGGKEGQSAADATAQAAKEAMRKLKIKYQDGNEEEVDEETVIKTYRERKGHQKAASKAMQEGMTAKKQAEELLGMMKDKQKLFDAIQKFGHDPRKLAEEFLASQLEDDLRDPREKELRSVKAELEKERAEKAARAKAEADARDAELKAKYSKDYSEKFVSALQESKLPATKPMIAEMAKYIHKASKIGFEMTPSEAAKLVREDIETAHRNLYGESDAETLIKLLGDQGLQKIRAYDVARLKSPEQNLHTPPPSDEPRQRTRTEQKRMTTEEWREFNRK